QTITISNDGELDLTLYWALEGSSGFRVANEELGWPLVVPADGHVDIGIAFDPALGGLHDGALVLSGDFIPEDTHIALSGLAHAPVLSVAPRIDAGDARVGHPVQFDVTLSNTGDYPLTIQGMLTGEGGEFSCPFEGSFT